MSNLALLIGTSSCPLDDNEFPELLAVRNDLVGLEQALREPPTGIFNSVERILDVSSGEIGEAVENACASVGRDDLLLLYFSGHGKIDEYNNLYLAAHNSRFSRLRTSTFTIDTLRNVLAACLSRQIVVILDCCHSGAASATLSKGTDVEALRAIARGTGRYVITSSGSFELSWLNDQGQSGTSPQSLFTHYLIEGIRTESADMNLDGVVDIDELYAYASQKTNRHNPKQSPTITKLGAQGDNVVVALSPRSRRAAPTRRGPTLMVVGPIGGVEGQGGMDRNAGNAYAYESCHIVSAWNLWRDENPCQIGLVAGRVDRSHPALERLHIAESSCRPDGRGNWPPDDYTTSMASLIAGLRDEAGFVGVAPGARLNIIDVLAGTLTSNQVDISKAIDHAVRSGAKVICLALGSTASSEITHDSIKDALDAGVCVVAAAGNQNSEERYYPAAFEESLSVASLDVDSKKASYSSFGDWIDIAAPGEDIWACATGGGHHVASGTSFSAAIVSGVLALMLSVNSALTPEQLRNILRSTADSLDSVDPQYSKKLGAGRINAYKAVLAARSLSEAGREQHT